jgi:hypothetical protein
MLWAGGKKSFGSGLFASKGFVGFERHAVRRCGSIDMNSRQIPEHLREISTSLSVQYASDLASVINPTTPLDSAFKNGSIMTSGRSEQGEGAAGGYWSC